MAVQNNNEENIKESETKVTIPGTKKENDIVTTQLEMEAYYIIKSILRSKIDGNRIVMRDAVTYCAILLDDNNRKTICRLHFNNEANLRVEFLDANGNAERVHIDSIDDIYNYAVNLYDSISRFL